jgi:hypothetical protein
VASAEGAINSRGVLKIRQLVPSRYDRAMENPKPSSSAQDDAKARRCASTDLSVLCPVCLVVMEQEHAHMRCTKCGYRDSCCM